MFYIAVLIKRSVSYECKMQLIIQQPMYIQAVRQIQRIKQHKKKNSSQRLKVQGAVYQKSETSKKATYSVNKMSAQERAALVDQLKADQQSRQQSLVKLVQDMMKGQAKSLQQGFR